MEKLCSTPVILIRINVCQPTHRVSCIGRASHRKGYFPRQLLNCFTKFNQLVPCLRDLVSAVSIYQPSLSPDRLVIEEKTHCAGIRERIYSGAVCGKRVCFLAHGVFPYFFICIRILFYKIIRKINHLRRKIGVADQQCLHNVRIGHSFSAGELRIQPIFIRRGFLRLDVDLCFRMFLRISVSDCLNRIVLIGEIFGRQIDVDDSVIVDLCISPHRLRRFFRTATDKGQHE